MFEQVNISQVGNYIASGDRQGQVTVKEVISGEVILTFKMDEGVVVREVFLLDDGKTVAASQKDKAIFWDLVTGQEISRLNQRIYGFSHDKTKFFTYNYPDGVFLYAYDNLTQICQLIKRRMGGPARFLFSPDDQFLVILFINGFPSSEKNYPKRNPLRSLHPETRLFNLNTCQEIQDFFRLRVRELGMFSPDSRFYNYKKITKSSPDSSSQVTPWRYDLITYEVREIS